MVTLTSLHIAYIVITVAVLAALLLKKEIVLPCALGILIIGYLYKGSLIGAVQTLNNAIIHSCIELLSIIVVIALVVAMSHAMIAVGADQMLMRPVGRIIRTRNTAFWAIGLAMLIVSWLIWPSPAVALIGALLLPVASRVGLPAIWAAVAMNLFGHGAGLSSDFFIQGAPDITATAAGVDTVTVMRASLPLWAVMCITTFAVAFFLMHRDLKQNPSLATVELHDFSRTIERPRLAIAIAVLIPAALLFDVGLMVRFGITGGDATALVAGTALILMSVTTIADHGVRNALEIATDHLRDGFIFAIKIFAPVIVIADSSSLAARALPKPFWARMRAVCSVISVCGWPSTSRCPALLSPFWKPPSVQSPVWTARASPACRCAVHSRKPSPQLARSMSQPSPHSVRFPPSGLAAVPSSLGAVSRSLPSAASRLPIWPKRTSSRLSAVWRPPSLPLY
ncbi:MAG: hypothetical protein ACLUB2_04490 [Butyricicoccus pullicaecorum]